MGQKSPTFLFIWVSKTAKLTLTMKKPLLARYFLASVLLLLVLVSLYVLSESRRLQSELLRQTEAKGLALAEAMAASAKNAILGNSLIEKIVSQRLLDNARLIDQLLLTGPMDPNLLQEISVMNRLQKIELLDQEGEPWTFPHPPEMPMGMISRRPTISILSPLS